MNRVKFESVYEQLELEFSWRRDELRLLYNQLTYMDKEEDKKRYRKSMIAMLYSHFEGFCYSALSIYVDTINQLKIKRSEINYCLATASMAEIFREYENKERRGKLFKKIDDTKLQQYYRQVEFISKMDNFLSEISYIPPIVVNTENNIGPDILKKLLYRLGLPFDSFKEFSSDIMKLLNKRNDIAHGKLKVGVEEKDYEEVQNAIINVMKGIIRVLMDSLTNKTYLKSTRFHRE